MRELSDFELLAQHTGLLEEPRHELMYQGSPTGFITSASDVVAQYQVDQYFLIATVLEVPKQEKLECFVLDKAFKQKAYRKYTGWFTSSFMVTGQQVLSENLLEIVLNKSIRIHLDVQKKKIPWPRVSLSLQPHFN